MANKPMGMFNIGSDTYEVVDIAGRQATSAVDEKVDAVDEKVDGLSASNLPYSSTQSTKEKIDEVNENLNNKEDKIASVSVTFRYANYGLWVKTNLTSSFQIIGVNTTDYMVLDGGGTSYVRIYSVGSQSITPAPTTSDITISCVVAKK